jgi:ribosome-binding factor A
MKNMGDGRRVSRVESEIQRLVAQYIISKMRDEIPGIVTVARVKMPADLRLATVYVSVLNLEGKVEGVIKTLQNRAPDIQRFIGDSLRMRYCPKLTFFEDEMTQKVLKVEGILRDLAIPESKSADVIPFRKEENNDNE